MSALVESSEKQIVALQGQVVELKSLVKSLEKEIDERDKQFAKEIKLRDETFREILTELAELREKVN